MSVASLSPGTLHRSRGQVLLTIAGVTQAMGSVDLSQNTTVTDNDVTTNEFYNKVVIDSQVDEMTFELTLGFHQVSRFALMIANLSDYHAVAQLAAQDVEVEFDLASGAFPIIVPLGYRLTSGHVVTDANDTDYVEGVHYTVHGGDRGFGFVSILAKPQGAAATGTVTFDAAAAKAVRFNIGELSSVEAKVEYLEAIKPGSTMSPEYRCYHRVQFRPDGDLTLISDSADPKTVTVKGKCVADTTKPAGQQIGFVETFVEAA